MQPTVTPVDTSPDQRNSVQVLETPGTQPFAVQVGAYQDQNNAMRAQKTLTTMYPHVWISMAPEGTQPLHRVRLGPFNNRDEAEQVVHAIKARGYTALGRCHGAVNAGRVCQRARLQGRDTVAGVPSGERHTGGVEGDVYSVTVAQRLKPCRNWAVRGPGLPAPMVRPSMRTTGMISAPVPVMKHSSAV